MTRLWHITWSVSLLLAAGVVAVWIACGWCSYVYQHTAGGWLDRAVFMEQGHLYLLWAEPGGPSKLALGGRSGWMPEPRGRWWQAPATPAREPKWSVLGAHYVPAHAAGDLNWLVLPLFWPLLMLLVLPATQAGRWCREGWRHRAGRCPACGYDLRASGESCPECGYAIEPAAGPRPAGIESR